MIQFAKLNHPVNLPALQDEVRAITQTWVPHFNTRHYQGGWSVISLRSPGGRSDGIIPDLLQEESFAGTDVLKQSPVIEEILHSFECPLMAVRLMNLKSGSLIHPHKDADLAFEKGEARLHIPVFTHELVHFYSEDKLLPMKAGECWYVNVNLTHRVENKSPIDRIHLVIDCRVNDWLTRLFRSSWCVTASGRQEQEDMRHIIHELRLQNTPVSHQLADEMEKQIK